MYSSFIQRPFPTVIPDLIGDLMGTSTKLQNKFCKTGKKAYICSPNMVSVVQLVEHRIVVPSVVGSSPITHPR